MQTRIIKTVGCLLAALVTLCVCACGKQYDSYQTSHSVVVAVEPTGTPKGLEESIDSDSEHKDEAYFEDTYEIKLNQVGYQEDDVKIAFVVSDFEQTSFQVVNDEGETVYEGELTTKDKEDINAYIKYADFSDFKEPGSYYIVSENQCMSSLFQISDDVYLDSLLMVADSFDEQKSELSDEQSNGIIYGTKDTRSIVGGWEQSFDPGKYVVSSSVTVANLLIAYELFEEEEIDIPSQYLDNIRYELDWLMRMQEENGGVHHKATTLKEDYHYENGDQIYIFDISTTATADFAAVMAMASRTFENTDTEYAKKCLEHAENAWEYLSHNRTNSNFENPKNVTTSAYSDDCDTDERFWAAAELFRTTNKTKYVSELKVYNEIDEIGFGWKNVSGYGYYTLLSSSNGSEMTIINRQLKTRLTKSSKEILDKMEESPYLAYSSDVIEEELSVSTRGIQLLLSSEILQEEKYEREAKMFLHYLLGANGESFNTIQYFLNEETKNSILFNSSLVLLMVGLSK